ncbi:unnamed protein product (mitochondrion) [Plasmodiophora brassicae]|uniref:ERCC1-like central domain-containing protein n=1 Tax=Plasmodiophora brassicae TaxID=37360 RepID=A0A3P3Y7C6_PLABS|nr:unnamed protein product [Plasmodiophora brassicae]
MSGADPPSNRSVLVQRTDTNGTTAPTAASFRFRIPSRPQAVSTAVPDLFASRAVEPAPAPPRCAPSPPHDPPRPVAPVAPVQSAPVQRANPTPVQVDPNVILFVDHILCDYQVGQSACILFLSARYHVLTPEYIHSRMSALRQSYRVRILLLLVDVEDSAGPIEDLTRLSFINKWTIICSFSIPEAAQYIESFKSMENAPPDAIKERIERDHAAVFSSVLTLIKSVNKTDVVTLAQTFGSLANVINASVDELSQCPGIGTLKATRIYEAFRQPFIER